MRTRICALIFTSALLPGFSTPLLAEETTSFSIDPNRVTVSGISSGGHMAHQLHIAYSDVFSGAGIIAGGPFSCANGSVTQALGPCMKGPAEELPVKAFLDRIEAAAEAGEIAPTDRLENGRAWLFHGALDHTVDASTTGVLAGLYGHLLEADRVKVVTDIQANHLFPTVNRGSDCGSLAPPFLGDCNYDAAGELLSFLYGSNGGSLKEPSSELESPTENITLPGAETASLASDMPIYVPGSCTAESACALHLVLHGCGQSVEKVGMAFVENSGYLRWADSNDIVLAFPQVTASAFNPLGCWDWWGYSSADYLWRNAPQQKVLVEWIQSVTRKP